MHNELSTESTIQINVSRVKVWETLTSPAAVKEWFMGTQLITDWRVGKPIIFKGEWKGQTYEDKGTVLRFEKEQILEYTHLSSRSDKEDKPENYEIITFALEGQGDETKLTVKETNLPTAEARDMSIKLWGGILEKLKSVAETTP